jgi:hypothetical protein
MKPKQIRVALERWMEENDKKPIDVAAETHVSLRTVERFLDGLIEEPSRLVHEAFERLIENEN